MLQPLLRSALVWNRTSGKVFDTLNWNGDTIIEGRESEPTGEK